VRWSHDDMPISFRQLAGIAIDEPAPPNLSVLFGDANGATRTKHQLFVQGRLTAVIASDAELILSMLRSMAALGAEKAPRALRLNASLLVAPTAQATVVDHQLADELRRLEPRARRSNQRIINLPFVDVHVESSRIFLPDWEAATGLSHTMIKKEFPTLTDVDDARGVLSLARLIYAGHPFAESRAAILSEMTPLVMASDHTVRTEHVRELAALMQSVETRAVPSGPTGLMSALELS